MRNKDGYSIIEVTLVMMIAGLIFLMVFIALPSMWANERDSERRTDVAYFIDRLKSFQTNNNRGALPSGDENTKITPSGNNYWSCDNNTVNNWAGFYKCYFNEDFMDPDGEWYSWFATACIGAQAGDVCSNTYNSRTLEAEKAENFEKYIMYIMTGATCDGPQAVKSANVRNVAVMYRLERSAIYCDNT